MANAALSNRQRELQRKRSAKEPRHGKPAGDGQARVARVASGAVDLPLDRDGLLWLLQRNRLTPPQRREAEAYRADFRELLAAGATLRSCLDVREGGAGVAGASPVGRVIEAVDAERRLYVRRFVILKGQVHMLEVLDAVCGRGLTLRELAGGRTPEAMVLERTLKIALDLLANSENAVLAKRTKLAQP